MVRTKRLFSILLVLLITIPSLSWAWSGKVIGVADGDTITVLRDREQIRIRLYWIDTLERGQAFGKKAKQFTSRMVYGKVVEVEHLSKDRYGRTIGLVALNKQLLNKELVRAGYAWVYFEYCHEMIYHIWHDLQVKAKMDKRGLWKDPKPIPP